jgi:hypothetical protein
VDPTTGIERCLPWVQSLCTGRWILRIDNDEVPSTGLLHALPSLLDAKDVVQYVLPMRWLFPDVDHFIDERPWAEDWHARLVRNEPFALRFPGRIHSDYEGVQPQVYVDLPLYHLNCAVTSREERERKAAAYERAAPGLEAMPGWPTNNLYRPESFQREPSSAVPADDARIIHDVLAPTRPPLRKLRMPHIRRRAQPVAELVERDVVDRRWPLRVVPESAYRATWHSVPALTELRAGRPNRVFVRVSNDGTETWPWGDQLPAFRLSYRWLSRDGTVVVDDGISTAFTRDVPPGSSILQPMAIFGPEEPDGYRVQFSLVHEGVRWFGEGPSFWVSVKD